jgi:hypothetical protein
MKSDMPIAVVLGDGPLHWIERVMRPMRGRSWRRWSTCS